MGDIAQRISAIRARRDALKTSISRSQRNLRKEQKDNQNLLKSRELLISFASQLQQNFRSEVQSLLTMAIRSVFTDREYEFKLEFKERKDRIEITPFVLDGTLDLIPKEDMGGGILPVIGFPLRVILLGDQRPMIWLDEPLKGALGRSDESFFRAVKMFKEVSSRAGIQVIINSHEEDFVHFADTVHRVSHDGNMSVVKIVKQRRSIVRRDR